MNQKGMTLVELLVVIVVASIIGIAVLNMFMTSNRTYVDQNKIIDVQREGRLVMTYITRTLREAGLNPLNSSDFQRIRYFDMEEIRIDRDSNLDGTLNNATEIISFDFDHASGTLRRGLNESPVAWRTIAKNIESFSFGYFNETGGTLGATSPASAISSVDVTIGFRDTKLGGGDFTRTYKTRVDLRNH